MARWVLGVDLGTSYSAGAVAWEDRAEILEVSGDRRVPSTVLLDVDGRLLVGPHARRAAARSPDRGERNPKHYVGRAPMLLGGEPATAVDALAALLALFVTEARRRHDGTDPAGVVVTHPVAWTDGQRAELAEAAARVLPGVEVELLAEPVAAAVHYVEETGPAGDRVAVYDLGGQLGREPVELATGPRPRGSRSTGRRGSSPARWCRARDHGDFGHARHSPRPRPPRGSVVWASRPRGERLRGIVIVRGRTAYRTSSSDEARKLTGTNFIVHGRFAPHAVRDGQLITGQQQHSGAAAARLAIEAIGA